MTGTGAGTWFRCWRQVPDPRLRLVAFPQAGGAASSFRGWPARLPADVELLAVCYPAREQRIAEPGIERMDELAGLAAAALLPLCGRPAVLFGHSMGASAAYEVALRLTAAGRPPAALFVSGQQPPERLVPSQVYRGGDQAMLADVRRLDGAHAGILDEPGVLDLVMPAIRADYTVCGSYRPNPAPRRLAVPVVAYGGSADPDVSREDLAAWADVTSGPFGLRVFPGDHFYTRTAEQELVADLGFRLDAVCCRRWQEGAAQAR